MKVTILGMTSNPKEMMIMAKSTRLQLHAGQFENIMNMSEAEKDENIQYVLNTVKTSWEFVDFTILIEDVTRAFTHQLVRNRLGSYAQQAMRIVDVGTFGYETSADIQANPEAAKIYHDCMANIAESYRKLKAMGIKSEDARGLLPTNIHTNIIAKYNLRALSQMFASRTSMRVQDEYRNFIDLTYKAITEQHPWLAQFLLEDKITTLNDIASEVTKLDFLDNDQKIIINKIIDKVRNNG